VTPWSVLKDAVNRRIFAINKSVLLCRIRIILVLMKILQEALQSGAGV
jgi:hypothetical protein